MPRILADLVRLLHYTLFVIVAIGPFLPRRYMPYYLLFVLLIFLDWNDFDGVCILTRVEHYLRTGNWNIDSPIEGGPEFFRPILSRMGFNITKIEADRLNNFIFLLFWGATFIRYVWFLK